MKIKTKTLEKLIEFDVFLEKACEWLKTLTYQEFAGAPQERLMTDEMIEDFKKEMEGQL